MEDPLRRISPRTIDYKLKSKKRLLKKSLYGRTKPGTLLKHHIPIKTDHWDVTTPGFTEVEAQTGLWSSPDSFGKGHGFSHGQSHESSGTKTLAGHDQIPSHSPKPLM